MASLREVLFLSFDLDTGSEHAIEMLKYEAANHNPGQMEIQCLVRKLQCGCAMEKCAAAWSIANLAHQPRNRTAIVTEGALLHLIHLLKIGSEQAKIEAARCIDCLSEDKCTGMEILKFGGLRQLLNVIKAEHTGQACALEYEVKSIGNLCACPEALDMFTKDGGVGAFVGLMKKHCPTVRRAVAESMVGLSVHTCVQREFAKGNGMGVVIDLLSFSNDEELRVLLVELVANLTGCACNQGALGETCGVFHLTQALQSTDVHCVNNALRALGNASQDERVRRLICREGGVRPIVEMLESENDCYVVQAARTLSKLCESSESATAVVRRGALGRLICLANNGNLDAVLTLECVSRVEGNCQALVGQGALDCLTELISATDGMHQLGALRSVLNVAQFSGSHSVLIEGMVVPICVQLLESDCMKTCIFAGEILKALAEGPKGRRKIQEVGGIWSLIWLLKNGASECKLVAASVLAQLSRDRSVRRMINQYDGISKMVELFTLLDVKTKTECTKERSYKDDQFENGGVVVDCGIPALMDMLSTGDFEAKEHALRTVIKLGVLQDDWLAIRDDGGWIIPLIKQTILVEIRDVALFCRNVILFFNRIFSGLIFG